MTEGTEGLLSEKEIRTASECMERALGMGADKVRISLGKSLMELFGTLNGELDKVSHCLDRSMSVGLFVDGRYGSFSTNRLEEEGIEPFLSKAISTVRMLAEDPCRDLPDPSRTAKDAVTGLETGLYDAEYPAMTAEKRLAVAMDAAVFKRHAGEDLVSEEGEYSDSVYDTLLIDSQGLRCRHIETSFDYGVEVHVQDREGKKYSGYWWDSSPKYQGLDAMGCGEVALKRARAQRYPERIGSGRYTMVVDNENAARLAAPIARAIGGMAIQQKNSFMLDTLGRKVFPEWLTLMDEPRAAGAQGARLFDSEGVAALERPVIENGVVKEYFINTYMSRKLGMEPTIEDVMRPVLKPCAAPGIKMSETFDCQAIMNAVGDGILVTGFNGGNSNPATGDFSFGIEGFLFRDGKTVHPVREMLITGNLLTLWNNLLAAGNDYRPCKSKLIPTLAFSQVDFSA